MLRKLEKLRTEPKHVRDRYAFYGAIFITGLVTLLWLVSLPTRFDPTSRPIVETKVIDGSFSRAAEDIKDQMASAVSSVQDIVLTEEALVAATDTDPYTLDIAAIFAATTTEGGAVEKPRTVLIATTSEATPN